MIKKIVTILLILLSTSCYNYTELNDLAIVSAIGIDYQNNSYHVTIQVVNTKKTDENENNNGFDIYEADGLTIKDAIKNISLICPKKIYLSHLEILIYGEGIAKKGINDTLDYLLRDNNIRGDFYIFIAKNNKANNILKINNNSFIINAESIKKLNETSYEKTGKSTIITFYELMDTYLNNNKEIVIPTIEIDDNNMTMNNLAVFEDDKLIYYLNEEDVITYNILTNKIKETSYKIKCHDGYIDILINNIKTNIKTDNDTININIKTNGNISSVTCDLNLKDEKNINLINNEANNLIKNNIMTFLNKNENIISIKDILYKNKKDYQGNINYNVEVKVNLISKGNTIEAVMNAK